MISPFDRMMRKVRERNGCLLFEGALDQNGHGNVRVQVIRGGELKWTCMKAHQVAYLHYHGALPEKPLVVRHTCDVRNCILEYHLIPGTHKENMEDMKERGRSKYCGNGRFKKDKDDIDVDCPF